MASSGAYALVQILTTFELAATIEYLRVNCMARITIASMKEHDEITAMTEVRTF